MNNERHAVITGGAGYIGSLLTSELLRANWRVTVLDSLLFGGESLVGFLHHPNFHFVKTDVTEPRAVRPRRGSNRRRSIFISSWWLRNVGCKAAEPGPARSSSP